MQIEIGQDNDDKRPDWSVGFECGGKVATIEMEGVPGEIGH